MDELAEQFLLEGRELVQQATEDLLALERAPGDAARLGEVGWLGVDLDCGQVRSHAACINRNKMFTHTPGCRLDLLDFLTDHWAL